MRTTHNPKLDQPTVDRILAHYTKLKLCPGWTKEKFYRLCNLLSCTPRELTAICGVIKVTHPHKKPKAGLAWGLMTLWLKRNNIPPYVALTLASIENAYLEAACGLKHEPTIPANLIVRTTEHVPSRD